MEVTPWIAMSCLYDWTWSPTPGEVRVSMRATHRTLLDRAGIYLVADTALAGDQPLDQLIYIGLAGGVGRDSTFHSRVHKHALKAMNVTCDTVAGTGITDTRRWSDYRTQRDSTRCALDTWSVRFLVLPNATPGERAAIVFAEQAMVLAFDRRQRFGNLAVTMPRCNSQTLGAQLLSVLDMAAPFAANDQDAPATPNGALMDDVPFDDDHLVEIEPDQFDDMAPEDTAPADAAFAQIMSPALRATYPRLLARLGEVLASVDGQSYGLRVHYTNTDQRDLRVAWNAPVKLLNLICVKVTGGQFRAYTRAPQTAFPADLEVTSCRGDNFRCVSGSDDVALERIARMLVHALAWARGHYGV